MGRGKWAVERERCRLDESTPPPPDQEALPISGVVDALIRRIGGTPQPWFEELHSEWPNLVGNPVARHARPGALKNRILTVFVDNSVWLSEIHRSGRRELLARLQARFGADRLAEVILRLDPDGGRPSERLKA